MEDDAHDSSLLYFVSYGEDVPLTIQFCLTNISRDLSAFGTSVAAQLFRPPLLRPLSFSRCIRQSDPMPSLLLSMTFSDGLTGISTLHEERGGMVLHLPSMHSPNSI